MRWFKRETAVETEKEEVESLTEREKFAVHLLKELAASREGNLLVSPFSVWSCLALLVPGARGETRRGLCRVLGLPEEVEADGWMGETRELISDLKMRGSRYPGFREADHELDVIVANAVWLQKEYSVREEYSLQVKKGFGATVEELDFAGCPTASADCINGWADRNTRGRITSVLSADEIHSLTRLVLTNATYFKDDWLEKFDPELTKPQAFRRRDGSKVKVPMMFQMEELDYYEDRSLQAVRLPYVHDGLSMIVVLPKRIEDFESSLTPASLEGLFTSIREPANVYLLLPKIELRDDLQLVPTLRTLGLEDLFGASADVSGITIEPGARVDQVKHLTFLRVDEQGTEAAAVTAVMTIGACPAEQRRKPKTMKVDRPFWLFLRDDRSGSSLFAGRVEDPS